MPRKLSERVLCFPIALLDALGPFQGISMDVERYFPAVVDPETVAFLPRAEAEADPSFKQVIPYVVFVHGDQVMSYRRGKRGSETRLHEFYSIGIGGHIEADETDLFNWHEHTTDYHKAMWREVKEEVKDDHWEAEACVAVINSDVTPVDRVHFGVVHLVRLRDTEMQKNETVITDAGFVPIEKALRDIDRYETWSRLCLGHINDFLRVWQD